jgi:hypothetical protein
LRTAAGEAILPARVTGTIAEGTVFVPFNQPGFATNTLLAGGFTAPVEIEAEAPDATQAADSPETATVGGESA